MRCRHRLARTAWFLVVVGVTSLVGPAPREASACTCVPPLDFILPLWGSRDVPRNTRIFVYRQMGGGPVWFHPAWEHVTVDAFIRDEELPDALVLESEDGAQTPLEVERADVRPEGPSTWWLAPKTLLDSNTRYRVRVVAAKDTPVITEFTTTTEVDKTPPATLLGVGSVALSYYAGPQPNNRGDCGGENTLRVAFAHWGRAPGYQDSPLNGIERVYLRRADGAYDLDAPLVDVPFVATILPETSGYSIGWNFACALGFRIELDECTEWCVRAHPVDLAGNVLENETEACATLSSLQPMTPEGPGERRICPGEVEPGDPSAPEAAEAGYGGPGGSSGGCVSAGSTRTGWPILATLVVASVFGRRARRPPARTMEP